jgi:hypothetical protein
MATVRHEAKLPDEITRNEGIRDALTGQVQPILPHTVVGLIMDWRSMAG